MSTRSLEGKTYWVVGASEGLGRVVAREMSRLGAKVILSARSEERLDQLATELPNAEALPMDVTDLAAVEAAVERARDVDGIIYCVGLYEPIDAAEWDPVAVERIVDANFGGAVRILGRLVPQWVRRGSGHVVLVGSLAAYRGLPGSIGYGASKAALRHLGEDMYIDLKGTGVDVQIANPGFIRTRLTDKNDFPMPQLMTDKQAAYHVMGLIRNPKLREVSFPRPFAWVFSVLGRILPFRMFARIVAG